MGESRLANGNGIQSPEELFRKAVDPNNFISTFILGHLWIEYLLVNIIKLKSNKSEKAIDRLTHSKLIDLVETYEVLDATQLETLRQINKMRNKLAHDISFEPSIMELKYLVSFAQSAFDDMTDGFEQTFSELEGKKSLKEVDEFVYPEMFMQIAYTLESVFVEIGGKLNSFEKA